MCNRESAGKGDKDETEKRKTKLKEQKQIGIQETREAMINSTFLKLQLVNERLFLFLGLSLHLTHINHFPSVNKTNGKIMHTSGAFQGRGETSFYIH